MSVDALSGNSVPLTQLMLAVAGELRGMHRAGGRIEAAVFQRSTKSLRFARDPRHGDAQEIQRLDHLLQSLDAIALFLEEMTPLIPEDVALDPKIAAAKIGLRDLAARLAGESGGQENEAACPALLHRHSGSVDLF